MWSGAVLLTIASFGTPPSALTGRPEAIPQLETLAAQRTRRGYFRDSTAIYRWLAALDPASPRVCAWQASVVNLAMMSGSKAETAVEIERLADVDRRLAAAADTPAEQRDACHRALHDILSELVFVWNRELTAGCVAYSWDKWPLLERMFRAFLAVFPDDARAPEARAQLDRLLRLERGEPRSSLH
jgi:hypothetical protein